MLAAVEAASAPTAVSSDSGRVAREHLTLARKYLAGDPRAAAWTDPYSPLYVFLYTNYLVLPKRRLAAVALMVGILVFWLIRRRRRLVAEMR
jgi:hypothetical protein